MDTLAHHSCVIESAFILVWVLEVIWAEDKELLIHKKKAYKN